MDDGILTAPLAGWLSGLGEVPDPVFATGLMGDGVAIDPVEGTLRAPCPATVVSIHASAHAVTLRADAGFELLLHIGVDTVAQAGRGFTPLVGAGDRVARGAPLIAFDLDRLAQVAPALVTPIVLTGEGHRIVDRGVDRMLAAGEPIGRVAMDAPVAADEIEDGETIERDAEVRLAHGVHARPAARIVKLAREHRAKGRMHVGDRSAPLDSLVEMMGLGVAGPGAVRLSATGDDAAALVDAVAAILAETEEADPTPRMPARSIGSDARYGVPVGVPAAPGMAIGPAHWLRTATVAFAENGEDPAAERARLDAAFATVGVDLDRLSGQGGPQGAVLAAHRLLLDDPVLRRRADAGLERGRSAPAAIRDAVRAQADVLRATGDRRLMERVDDLEDVSRRLIAAALGRDEAGIDVPAGAILLADELLPSQIASLAAAGLGGICLKGGGPTSHVAIIAAGMGVPMLVAAGAAIDLIADGTTLILDADQGVLAIDPDAAELAIAETERAGRATAAAADAARTGGGRTADGVAVPILANLGSVADADAAVAAGAEGSGLLRTEFLFLERATPPDAGEQAAQYQAIADTLGDRPLTVRLLDVGGDKPAPYLALPPEENPALGLRGVRVSLARPDLLEAQLRAILAVAPAGRCRIMAPMICDAIELAAVREVLDRLCAETGAAAPPLGVMVETPAAAIGADLLAETADFLSIGSNDLTQYALAMDRGNPAVASGVDGLHPAVLRLIAAACEGAARHGRPVGVCGGLAAEALAVPILIGLGVRSLSMPAARIGAIRALVGRVTVPDCVAHARATLACPGPQQVRALARHFAQELAA